MKKLALLFLILLASIAGNARPHRSAYADVAAGDFAITGGFAPAVTVGTLANFAVTVGVGGLDQGTAGNLQVTLTSTVDVVLFTRMVSVNGSAPPAICALSQPAGSYFRVVTCTYPGPIPASITGNLVIEAVAAMAGTSGPGQVACQARDLGSAQAATACVSSLRAVTVNPVLVCPDGAACELSYDDGTPESSGISLNSDQPLRQHFAAADFGLLRAQTVQTIRVGWNAWCSRLGTFDVVLRDAGTNATAVLANQTAIVSSPPGNWSGYCDTSPTEFNEYAVQNLGFSSADFYVELVARDVGGRSISADQNPVNGCHSEFERDGSWRSINGVGNPQCNLLIHAVVGPTSWVSGRVTDRSGAGLGGVRLDDGAGHSVVTDPLGNYILSGLPPGLVTLTPSSDGYLFTPATYAAKTPPNLKGINFSASPARVVVLLAGVDSSGSCVLSAGEEPDEMGLRIGGSVFGKQAQTGIRRFVTDSFQQFSYSGITCGGASNAAIYSAYATCGGVRDAAGMLQQMIAALPPGTRVDVVGQSLGGMVAAYWATQQGQSLLDSRVHSIVTLDSPLYGFPWRQFLLDRLSTGIGKFRFAQPSACDPNSLSAGDIAGRATWPSHPSVKSVIDDVALTTSRVSFAGVKCTAIGALLPGQHAFIADTLTGPTDHTCGYTQATVLDQLAQWLLR